MTTKATTKANKLVLFQNLLRKNKKPLVKAKQFLCLICFLIFKSHEIYLTF